MFDVYFTVTASTSTHFAMFTSIIEFLATFPEPQRTILILIADFVFVILLYIFVYVLRSISFLVNDKRLGRKTVPYENSPKIPEGHFLIIGDSLASGVGAVDFHNSVAGRLVKDYPTMHISNRGQNGFKLVDIVNTLPQLEEQFFDMIILQIGGNDILAYTSPSDAKRHLQKIITTLKKISNNNLILVGPLNAGSSAIFWFPFSTLYNARSNMIRGIFYDICKSAHVPFVDLYVSRFRDPFVKNRDLYFANDKIHPSDEGYSYIYNKIKEIIDTKNAVASRTS